MAKSVSITVHPSVPSGEYLTVSDAFKQVLDLVNVLESVETEVEGLRQIVWRLVEAHTNSPPFTVVVEPFSKDPQIAVASEARAVSVAFALGVKELGDGVRPPWFAEKSTDALARVLKRNLNGIGATEVRVPEAPIITITPTFASRALATLEHLEIDLKPEDRRRVEYGSIEGIVIGLTRYHSSPAIVFQERLSNEKVICVLSRRLTSEIGPAHAWSEAWEDRSLRIGGELIYGSNGQLKRVYADYYEDIQWADVAIADLKGVDILDGRSIQAHIASFWGDEIGESR